VFVRDTPGSQALERGLRVLRAFRPGTTVLTNAELAQRTGLPRPTISRLTRSLVDSGFLDYDVAASAYRLGAPFLSFGLAVRQGSIVLETALPLMREVAEGLRINVGLAVADDGEMIYLESVRRSRLGVFRHVVSGSRLPIEATALGRAWLSGVGEGERRAVLGRISAKHGTRWPAIEEEVAEALAQIEQIGYCSVAWQVGMVSVAAPVAVPGFAVHAMNISFPVTGDERASLEARYAPLLGRMVAEVAALLRARSAAAGNWS
jgi:DNA-binding IclR family transcriptional regulator